MSATPTIETGIILQCRRKRAVFSQRKFVAECGSKIVFNLDRTGAIVNTDLDHEKCKTGCKACEDRLKQATKIILKNP